MRKRMRERAMLEGKSVLFTEPNKVYNDQLFILDSQQLVVSDSFWPYETDSTNAFGGAPDAPTVAIYNIKAKDMCDVDGVVTADGIACEWSVLAWNSDGGSVGHVQLTTGASASASTTRTVAANHNLPTWGTSYSTINIRTNDVEEVLTLKIRRESGAGKIYIAGFFLVALET